MHLSAVSICMDIPFSFSHSESFLSRSPSMYTSSISSIPFISDDSKMKSRVFDQVQIEKDEAIKSFKRFRRVANLWRSLAVLAVISWSAARVPAAVRMMSGYYVDLAAYILNQHVVFLVWNALAVTLFVLCRKTGGGGGNGIRDGYEAARPREATLPSPREEEEMMPPAAESGAGDERQQIVVLAQGAKENPQCDDVAAVIEKAARKIDRYQRTQSEKLKEVIAARQRSELRICETENRLTSVDSGDSDASAMETLSNEEFRRRVDAFIEERWPRKR